MVDNETYLERVVGTDNSSTSCLLETSPPSLPRRTKERDADDVVATDLMPVKIEPCGADTMSLRRIPADGREMQPKRK